MTMHEKAEDAAETLEQLKQMQQTEQPKPEKPEEEKKRKGEGKRTETVRTISRKCHEWNDRAASLTGVINS